MNNMNRCSYLLHFLSFSFNFQFSASSICYKLFPFSKKNKQLFLLFYVSFVHSFASTFIQCTIDTLYFFLLSVDAHVFCQFVLSTKNKEALKIKIGFFFFFAGPIFPSHESIFGVFPMDLIEKLLNFVSLLSVDVKTKNLIFVIHRNTIYFLINPILIQFQLRMLHTCCRLQTTDTTERRRWSIKNEVKENKIDRKKKPRK